MNELNFEKIRTEFDLEDFLLQPVGKFTKDDLKLIYRSKKNIKSIPILAKMMGFKNTMSIELITVKNDSEWKRKAHDITDGEAVEIFFRLYLLDSLIQWCKETE
ncbi:MAG: hypothetical protein IKR77_00230 [Bacteroidales bacterium]|nr:hypothetical protein [Bacteroidales bacterium]